MIYVGVDPGTKGALAYIDLDGSAHVVVREDNYGRALGRLKEYYRLRPGDIRCCIEKLNGRNNESISTMFKLGVEVGYAEGVLEALEVPYQEIAPSKWKKEFGLINKDKKDSIAVARALFPDVLLRRNDRCKVDDDNMAEALLMAEYARRKFGAYGTV